MCVLVSIHLYILKISHIKWRHKLSTFQVKYTAPNGLRYRTTAISELQVSFQFVVFHCAYAQIAKLRGSNSDTYFLIYWRAEICNFNIEYVPIYSHKKVETQFPWETICYLFNIIYLFF